MVPFFPLTFRRDVRLESTFKAYFWVGNLIRYFRAEMIFFSLQFQAKKCMPFFSRSQDDDIAWSGI